MKQNGGLTVDLRVTGRCNMDCNFCHGAPKHILIDPSLSQIVGALDKLSRAWVSRVVLSGGEPLLRKDIVSIAKHAHDLGLGVYLSTNGLLLDCYYDTVSPYLDCIGLPLDGSSPGMNALMSRSSNLYDATLGTLKRLHRWKPSHKVKVGTVVSRVNIDDIDRIGSAIFEDPANYQPDVWRLYEFSPRVEGLKSKKLHSISPDEFEAVVRAARTRFGEKVSALSNTDHDNSYIFINPDFSIVTAVGESNPYLGNLMELGVEDVRALFASLGEISRRGRYNRKWLT